MTNKHTSRPAFLDLQPDFILDNHLADLVRKVAENPDVTKTYLALAQACNGRLLYQEAQTVCNDALARWPEDGPLWHERLIAQSLDHEFLEHALQLFEDQEFEDDESLILAQAFCLWLLGKDQEALVILDGVAAHLDKESRFHEIFGYIHQGRGAWDEAMACFRHVILLNPEYVRPYRLVGECYREAGDTKKAKDWDERVVKMDPGYLRAWNSLGKLHLESGNLVRASQCFGIAQHINPRDWDIYFTLADYYLELGQNRRAAAECQKILDLNPDDRVASEALNFYGYSLFLAGDLEGARRLYHQALDRDPQFALAWANLGDLLTEENNHLEAINCFQKALKNDPSMVHPRILLGHALLEVKRVNEAEVMFLKALEKLPNEPAARLGLAEVFRRKKKYDLQLGETQRALEVEPENPEVHNHMAIAYECLNEDEKAITFYEKALELNPLHRWAANNVAFLYEGLADKKGTKGAKTQALNAWKRRLLICREMGSSTKGAEQHLKNLGASAAQIKDWLQSTPYPED